MAGKKQQKVYMDGLERRFRECINEKNCTLIRYDILQSMRNVYDAVKDEKNMGEGAGADRKRKGPEVSQEVCCFVEEIKEYRSSDRKKLMFMKGHILAALREEFASWEELLSGLSEEKIRKPGFDLSWSVKDVVAHLWVWQQISIARMEAGWHNREPEFPDWIVKSVENWEDKADHVNAMTFERYHEKPWFEIHQSWKDGFLRLLEIGEKISERDLLDGDRYPWLKGYSLAFILVASYDHHQEHLEKMLAWLKEG